MPKMRRKWEPHRRWIASLPCCCCGREGGTQAAHVRQGHDDEQHKGGAGFKPPDWWTIPLHYECHYSQTHTSEAEFEERRGIDMKDQARKYARISPYADEMKAEREAWGITMEKKDVHKCISWVDGYQFEGGHLVKVLICPACSKIKPPPDMEVRDDG